MKIKELFGILVPICTPFNNGRLDIDKLKSNMDQFIHPWICTSYPWRKFCRAEINTERISGSGVLEVFVGSYDIFYAYQGAGFFIEG